jgi:predicted nucleic acid-binding Zn ribbon protein
MRTVTQSRLRTSTASKPFAANLPCALCQSDSEFHLHCMVCRSPLEISTSRKTCPGDCQKQFKSERRKARSVRLWVQIEHGEAKRMWLPKRSVKGMDTGVSTPFGAHGTIPRKNTSRNPKGPPNG